MTDNDFGFTAVSTSDLVSEHVGTNIQPKLDQIFNLMSPLLTNLQKDPDKDILKWPDRAKAVAKLQLRFNALCNKT